MKILPIIKITAGIPGQGKGIRSFYAYERSTRNRFIREQVKILGKENVNIEIIHD